jgi:2-polyprenyl-3-methyl-5-hydroxy-6-metoxy-1,4-benzoquinol methylase
MDTHRYGKDWDPTRHYRNERVAREYDRARFSGLAGSIFNHLDRTAVRRALADLPAGSLIGDLPCGTGRLAEVALALGFRVHGMDVSPEMLDVARRRLARFGNRFTAETGDVLDLRGRPRFDAVLSARFLMHFPPDGQRNLVRALASASRGRVVLTQGIDNPFHRLRRAAKRRTGWFQNPAVFPLSNAQLAEILAASGLAEIRRHAVLPGVSEAVAIVAEKTQRGRR